MLILARSRLRGATTVTAMAVTAVFLAGCMSTPPKAMVNTKKRSKEYFSESDYGVKASPRVSYQKSNLKRGGGRDQIGKPYKVRGKVYYPKEDKHYKKTGLASWYGDAFHGRLTANGEVYDMTHLTAAHPTMPLPSYARVTNLENGSSVIVRVNDRGPYSNNRLIDLSSRAADMLDYKRVGTAKVKVEYVGRAPLDGEDDSYLMASYRPGNRAPDPSDGLPTGVMIAMNGPTPSAAVGAAAASFPGMLLDQQSVGSSSVAALGDIPLPEFGPIAPERPGFDLPANSPFAIASLSYAEDRRQSALGAFAALEGNGLTSSSAVDSWKRLNAGVPSASVEPYIAAGTFTAAAEADGMARTLASLGRIEIEKSDIDGTDWYSVNIHLDGRNSIDAMLEGTWANGAVDAIAIRD